MNISGMMGGMGGMPNISAMRDKLFQKADLNGDSGISLEEFTSAGKKMPIGQGASDAQSAEAFGKIDTDGNDSISKDELKAFGDKMSSQMQAMMMKMQEMMSGGSGGPDPDTLFGKADADSDGAISRSEFDRLRQESPLARLLGEQDQDALGKIDSDGDGSVSKTEFNAFATDLKEKMQGIFSGGTSAETLMQGMNAYGKNSASQSSTDLMTTLLDMLDSGKDEKRDDDRKVKVDA